jgi:hypothetical protein
MMNMSALKAVVHNGHLTLDVSTDLPEGTVVELEPVDPYAYLDAGDELDDDERNRLHAAIREGLDDIQKGHVISAEDFIKEIDAL